MLTSLRIKNPFASLFSSTRREQYLTRYALRETAKGRPLDEVLTDPYIRNRSTPEERARLIEQPEILKAIGARRNDELERALDRSRTPTDVAT
jgi:hypothetical protein